MLLSLLVAALALVPASMAMDDAGHRQRRIYQVVTDRFARSGSGTCNVADAKYCGGNYQSLISRLGYIQGMGFDTVWISPIVQNIGGTTGHGEAYHGYWTLDPAKLVSSVDRAR
jgi:alpha-amylase